MDPATDISKVVPSPDVVENLQVRNRRAHERFTVHLNAICEMTSVAGSAYYCTVTVISLSTHGAACISPRSFPRGTSLRFELANASRTIWHERHARAMHERPTGDSNWIVGCEFLSPLSEEQVRELLG